jgi:DNA-binding protein HU-beta
MNRQDLVNCVAAQGLTKKQARSAVDAVLGGISDALKKGDKVTLVGFGNFGVRNRAKRKGRNPQTGAEITIPAKKVAFFRPGKDLRSL